MMNSEIIFIQHFPSNSVKKLDGIVRGDDGIMRRVMEL